MTRPLALASAGLALTAALAIGAAPAAAQTATTVVYGTTPSGLSALIINGPELGSHISVYELDPGTVTVKETEHELIYAAPPCKPRFESLRKVDCPAPSIQAIHTFLGPGDDIYFVDDELFDLELFVDGGGGNDDLDEKPVEDVFAALPGSDTAEASAAADRPDTFIGGPGGDVLEGGLGADRLTGGQGNDRLFGGSGRDLIFGGPGNDFGRGGGADDRGRGGPGKDNFRD